MVGPLRTITAHLAISKSLGQELSAEMAVSGKGRPFFPVNLAGGSIKCVIVGCGMSCTP